MESPSEDISGYRYSDPEASHTHGYLLTPVLRKLEHTEFPTEDRRVFDLGCGNGATAARLEEEGYAVTGVDPSREGIEQAHEHYPELDLHQGSGYDDLARRFGRFPVVISLEVIEHVYAPRHVAETIYNLLIGGGVAIISTPYHGYLKNVMLALAGAYDQHHDPLWDHGHIKFWSMDTLQSLLDQIGFVDIRFERVGRIPPLAKSMIAIARKPETSPKPA